MTGEGVNNAPALKKADYGIAVSGASDAARGVASIVLLTSGLSVIIDAIKESRKIIQRMNSYAVYRIAETLRVLLFMTVAIMSIAYDNVLYKDKPEVMEHADGAGVATLLDVFGVVSDFGLFYLGERVFHLDRAHIQTLMYLELSVARHLTIYLTRTRGSF
jgi:H+-transporting ATPase